MSSKTHTILIVEDENDLRITLSEILEISGYDVSTAVDGIEGFEAIHELNPDLVLCDVNMPRMNGFELLISINQQLESSLIPKFIFLSARIQPEDSKYGIELGADAFITKPFDTSELLISIEDCLLKN